MSNDIHIPSNSPLPTTIAEIMAQEERDFITFSELSASEAVKHMLRSERGERALRDFFSMLDNGGCSLDNQNYGCLIALIKAMRKESGAFSKIRDLL